MGISLYGLTPATTYDALIKTGDNAPIDATLKPLSDGVGTNLPMEASTTGVNFTGALQQSGVAVPTAAQVAAKQDTLVSGTNIKTINGTSVLGSGNIVTPSTPPSGVSGAIQFSTGSAFNSDAANFFWDNTNKRLGIGTNAPTQVVDIVTTTQIPLKLSNNQTFVRTLYSNNSSSGTFDFINNYFSFGGNNLVVGSSSNLNARLGVVGSGSTSATTSLLVQNSAGTAALTITDDRVATFGQTVIVGLGGAGTKTITATGYYITQRGSMQNPADGVFLVTNAAETSFDRLQLGGTTASFPSIKRASNNIEIKNADDTFGAGLSVGAALNASAILQADSTTKGFLPPRMTTTQKNAIATPAAGLVVYDNTTNKLQCYNGSTWNDLF